MLEFPLSFCCVEVFVILSGASHLVQQSRQKTAVYLNSSALWPTFCFVNVGACSDSCMLLFPCICFVVCEFCDFLLNACWQNWSENKFLTSMFWKYLHILWLLVHAKLLDGTMTMLLLAICRGKADFSLLFFVMAGCLTLENFPMVIVGSWDDEAKTVVSVSSKFLQFSRHLFVIAGWLTQEKLTMTILWSKALERRGWASLETW